MKSCCKDAGCTKLSKQRVVRFQKTVYAYYHSNGRHDMPWRLCYDPYNVVVSEVMLQQTQVNRVLDKYTEFLSAFTDFQQLAHADLKSVLQVWQGLGYNRRAIALHKLANIIINEFGGSLPQDIVQLQTLPGIGYNTACSIAAFAFNMPVCFIETNIRTVYIHEFFADQKSVDDAQILELVTQTMDMQNPRQWYYAIMDYGVMLKKTIANPSRRSAHYRRQSKFEGSSRQLRGKLVKLITEQPRTLVRLAKDIQCDLNVIEPLAAKLVEEGFFTKTGKMYRVR